MHPTPLCARIGRRWSGAVTLAIVHVIAADGAFAQTSVDGASSRSSFPDTSSGPQILDRFPIFFPPNPPPLGRPASRGVAPGPKLPAPPELAPYVCEFFYPALGTRLAMKSLSERLSAQLDRYHAAKLALQNELRAELDRLRDVDPAPRADALASLSTRQTPKIAELEKTAEQLRRDLVSSHINWSALRQWHLSDKARRGYSPIEIAQVMRAYAFYQNNLLPAQRRLLREIAIELVFAAETTTAAAAAQPYVFFPPEPARVLFPDDLSAGVAAKLASYQTKKSTLKKELYDAVHAADGEAFGFLRSSMRTIADKQAARLAELDTLAEEIRRGLKEMPPPRAERSPLPVALDARASTMILSFIAAQKNAAARIDAILARAMDLPIQASYRFESDGLKFLVVPSRGGRRGGPGGQLATQIEAVRAEVSAVAEEYGRQMAEMLNERESIRQEIAQTLHLNKPEDIERVLFVAMRIATQKEADNAFSEYRIAVFEPGLSPEQRRLLFDSVVERLELPLPRGDLQPVYRAETW